MYQVYLVTKDDVILFPFSPSEIQIRIKNKDKIIDFANHGEVTILKKPGITSIQLDMRLFSQEHPGATYLNGFKDPGWFIDRLIRVKENKEYMRLVIIRENTSFDTNLLVSIDELEIPEVAEDGSGDFNLPLRLSSYKDVKTDSLELKDIGNKKALVRKEKSRPAKQPKTSVVVGDKSLWEIAKNELNDENKVKDILKLNNLSSVNEIKPGEVLRLQ